MESQSSDTQNLVYVVCAEVALAKVVWSYRMELSGKNCHIGILIDDPPRSSRSAEQIDQDDVVFGNLVLLQHLHCFANFIARAHDWVEQENFSVGDVIWELCKDHVCLMGVTVRIDKDLADPHRATAILECFFHCFPRPETRRD